MGLMSFSLFLRKRGADVLYLGPDTPLADLERIIDRHKVSFIAASVTDVRYADRLIAWIDAISRSHPKLRFILGGAAFDKIEKRIVKPNLRYLPYDEWDDWQNI
nr:cobalamin B12-binding domain-containing protein [Paenibacillus taihuensis]